MISNMVARIVKTFRDVAGVKHLAGDVVEIDHYMMDHLGNEYAIVHEKSGYSFIASRDLVTEK